MSLSLAITAGIIGGFALLAIFLSVLLICAFGPFPLNKWIFKGKYSELDSDDEFETGSKGSGEFDFKKVKEGDSEHDMILESVSRHGDKLGRPESPEYERYWEAKPNSVRPVPPVRLDASVHLDGRVLTEGRVLTVKVHGAADTPGPLLGLWHNNVIKLQLLVVDQNNRRRVLISEAHTGIVSKTSTPKFEESMRIMLPAEEDLSHMVLCIYCCDFDKYARVVIVGELTIHLGQFISGDSRAIQIQDLPMNPPDMNQDHGELLIALNHMATSEQIRLVLLKARGLHAPDGRTVDPYVTVVVVRNHEVKFRRRTGIVKCAENPVFNEVINLYLDEDLMENAVIVISVMHCHLKKQIRQDMDQCIGRLCVGKPCYGSGQPHWLEMLASPRKSLAYWHKLS